MREVALAARWVVAVDARRNRRNLVVMALISTPCPYLPAPRPGLDWRSLHAYRESERGPAFYFACLEYGQTLWMQGYAARVMLCLDRAMGADLTGEESVLRAHPLPYRAFGWILTNTPAEIFLGNPRVHFQHYADRMNAPRREQRRWRAWAGWALARAARPELRGDAKHVVVEPSESEIVFGLRAHGHVGEAELWLGELQRFAPIAGWSSESA